MITDFSSINGYGLEQLVNVNSKLFFTLYAYDGLGNELYVTDGTAEGTVLVKDINADPYSSSNPGHLTPVNGLLYFAANDGSGSRLWVSDGTEEGTNQVKNDENIYAEINYYTFYNDPFPLIKGVLYFQGSTAETGYELAKYDTKDANASIRLVKDIIPGEASSNPSNMTNVKGTLFFNTQPGTGDQELWKTDGTEAGTVLVKDINSGGENYFGQFINVKGTLFFNYTNDEMGAELWKSDGTTAGTVLVEDIYPGAKSSHPSPLTNNDGILLFAANRGAKGRELWKSDGTQAGTVMVKDINTTTSGGSYPRGFTAVDSNKVIFNAGDQNHNGLWVTDGTAEGTDFLKNLTFYSPPTSLKGKAYFQTFTASGVALAKTDGTKPGTKVFYQFNGFPYLPDLIASRNLVYFSVYNDTTAQVDLWRTNGTTSGTYPIKANVISDYYSHPVAVGKTLFFKNYDDEHGYELWKTDGTAEGTGLVKDILPGIESSNPQNFYSSNGKLFFSAINNGNYVLYTSDGTEAGTTLVKYIAVNSNFAQVNGKLFFSGYRNLAKGSELYATDGTAAGTFLVKDIAKGPVSSTYNTTLISGDSLVYFMADDIKHGQEIWRSNGTKEGTFLLKNITPGEAGTYLYPPNAVTINDHLIFVVNDTLWQSDGTKKGTHRVNDETIEGVSRIFELTVAHDKVYFSAYTYAAGQELYVGDFSSVAKPVQTITASPLVTRNSNAFEAKLLTNPIVDQLKFSLNVKNQQEAQVMISDAGGRVLASGKRTLSAGTNIISYDTKSWMQGMYIVRIVSRDGSSSSLKAIK
jgi:ELWxxDGT repeat protein